jgi:hypothetical protein
VKSKSRKAITLFCLFGWKISNGEAECQYCGSRETSKEEFHVIESHGSTCAMKNEKYWEAIIEKLTLDKLEDREGECPKTEGEATAK